MPDTCTAPTPNLSLADELRSAVRLELQPMFADLRRFVDRRILELSAELHASVELADMTEEKLSRELAQVHEQIASLVAAPTAASRNSGIELEAVVEATETAANTIMEAAEAISDWIHDGGRDPASIQALASRVNAIFEACSFQDVTGQRIRRAIQHLQHVETMLEKFLPAGSLADAPAKLVVPTQRHTMGPAAAASSDLAQNDIDALLNF
ncbi:protein phosphatase CheZ [Humitalea sp. 24SJ18S-53]|uniref:protein phosphatase CheZ n=1 Tax=Humitalea sp. 24SJ18S-53 TaxID=3422307 RepID=UPI003D67E271